MKTIRDVQAFIEASGKPVLLQLNPAGWSVQTLLFPGMEFTGESLEACCTRMADYVEMTHRVPKRD